MSEKRNNSEAPPMPVREIVERFEMKLSVPDVVKYVSDKKYPKEGFFYGLFHILMENEEKMHKTVVNALRDDDSEEEQAGSKRGAAADLKANDPAIVEIVKSGPGDKFLDVKWGRGHSPGNSCSSDDDDKGGCTRGGRRGRGSGGGTGGGSRGGGRGGGSRGGGRGGGSRGGGRGGGSRGGGRGGRPRLIREPAPASLGYGFESSTSSDTDDKLDDLDYNMFAGSHLDLQDYRSKRTQTPYDKTTRKGPKRPNERD